MKGWNAEFMSPDEVVGLGLAAVGRHVLVHRMAVLVNCEAIHLADHVRIDPFVLISAGERVSLGRHVHIATGVSIIGTAPVDIGDFVSISQGSRLLSSTDDFSGEVMTGATVPIRYRDVKAAPISIGRHAVVATGSVVLPGASVGEGAVVGALSLVTRRLEPWTIHVGIPTRPLKPRARAALKLEEQLRRDETPAA